jgi:hypothetical protein
LAKWAKNAFVNLEVKESIKSIYWVT